MSYFKVTIKAINIDSVVNRVLNIDSGAVVIFIGTVRKSSHGREVLYLEYEAYENMAIKEFRKLAAETKSKWNVKKVSIVHRIGRLKVGEISVVIAVASPHRDDAYKASRYIIEKLKQKVPIWKKEAWDGGLEWIQGT
ncbi:molybdenum cofactor biosynthesis protein MoaE [Desulfobacterota bacterium AH_259_B03_O07]|nr:molybdenum cofactor biosynthesis protein MoaE [Desulfobacterota bacterium AH_259_B03_O07]